MAIIDDKMVKRYLQGTVDKVFKILPLYEENNPTLKEYINSLIIELKGFVAVYGSVGIEEYITVIATLQGLQSIIDSKGNQPVVKREVFKSIEMVNKISNLLEGG